MTEEEQFAVYKSVRSDIWNVFGTDSLFIAMAHNCMEVPSLPSHLLTCTY